MTEKDKIQYVKYSISIASFIVSYFNFVQNISSGAGLFELLFYSGSLFLIAVLLVAIPGKWILIVVFVFTGLMMVYDTSNLKQLSPGVVMFMFAGYLLKGIYARLSLYSMLILAVIYVHIIHGLSAASTANNLIGYISILVLTEMLYNKDEESI